jgi:periplasmic divalent cation tolerance protein
LRLKTRADLADRVEAEIRRLHPYEVPCILRSDARANADYEAWVHRVTRARTSG